LKKKTIGLIDGRSGNIGSIKKAIKDIIKNQPFRLKVIEGDFNLDDFDKIILPGQGAYATLMKNLKVYNILNSLKLYLKKNKSYFGICVGMQILSERGYENKTTKGLGFIPGNIKKFPKKKLITPHMGWNSIKLNKQNNEILTKTFDNKDFYFVHSYTFQNIPKKFVLASTNYGGLFPSIVNTGNIYGVQFHPEKSHKNGINLIKNFILKA
jgi:glutamine amidotransferase